MSLNRLSKCGTFDYTVFEGFFSQQLPDAFLLFDIFLTVQALAEI